jgi:hypothetical protein
LQKNVKNYENHLETLGVVQKRRMMTPLARNPVTPTCQQQSCLMFVVPAVQHNLFSMETCSNTAFGKSFGAETKVEDDPVGTTVYRIVYRIIHN